MATIMMMIAYNKQSSPNFTRSFPNIYYKPPMISGLHVEWKTFYHAALASESRNLTRTT